MATASALFSSVPAGALVPFAGSTAPAGWLLAYGQAVSRTAYAALFAAIGTTYGVGDGSTTFNLPDLEGRAVFGKDDMSGSAAGRLNDTGVEGTTDNPDGTTLGATGGSDRRTINRNSNTTMGVNATAASPGTLNYSTPTTVDGIDIRWVEQNQHSGLTNANGEFSVVPPAIVLNYIIKT